MQLLPLSAGHRRGKEPHRSRRLRVFTGSMVLAALPMVYWLIAAAGPIARPPVAGGPGAVPQQTVMQGNADPPSELSAADTQVTPFRPAGARTAAPSGSSTAPSSTSRNRAGQGADSSASNAAAAAAVPPADLERLHQATTYADQQIDIGRYTHAFQIADDARQEVAGLRERYGPSVQIADLARRVDSVRTRSRLACNGDRQQLQSRVVCP